MVSQIPENEWVTIFKTYDKDNNGYIDIFELRDMLRARNPNITDGQIVDSFISLEGAEGDKKITLEEFTTGIAKLIKQIQALKDYFKQVDTDNSGYLDKKELAQIVKKAFPSATDAEITKIFHDTDTSGDGKISLTEFLQVFE